MPKQNPQCNQRNRNDTAIRRQASISTMPSRDGCPVNDQRRHRHLTADFDSTPSSNSATTATPYNLIFVSTFRIATRTSIVTMVVCSKAVFLFETTRDEVRKVAPAQFYVLYGLYKISWSDFSTQNIVLALRFSSNTKWRFQIHTTRALLSYFFANTKRSEKNTK